MRSLAPTHERIGGGGSGGRGQVRAGSDAQVFRPTAKMGAGAPLQGEVLGARALAGTNNDLQIKII